MYFTDEEREAFRNSKDYDMTKFPDDDYVGILEDISVKHLGAKQEPKLILKYLIKSPQRFSNSYYTQFISLINKNAYGVLKSILRKFGFNPDEIELDDVVGKLKYSGEGSEVHFSLLTKETEVGSFQNLRISAVVPKGKEENVKNKNEKVSDLNPEIKPIDVDDDIPW